MNLLNSERARGLITLLGFEEDFTVIGPKGWSQTDFSVTKKKQSFSVDCY